MRDVLVSSPSPANVSDERSLELKFNPPWWVVGVLANEIKRKMYKRTYRDINFIAFIPDKLHCATD